MSTIVDSIPPRRGQFVRKYPWERWTDGRLHACSRGEDFETSSRHFVLAARQFAATHGYRATARVRENVVYLMFVPAPGQRPGAAE